ncbi:MAG: pentapeptide repeat-containing protein [Pseudomonadota bacterium]
MKEKLSGLSKPTWGRTRRWLTVGAALILGIFGWLRTEGGLGGALVAVSDTWASSVSGERASDFTTRYGRRQQVEDAWIKPWSFGLANSVVYSEHRTLAFWFLRGATLTRERLVEKPENWLDFDLARSAFFLGWCNRRAFEYGFCDPSRNVSVEYDRARWCARPAVAEVLEPSPVACENAYSEVVAQVELAWSEYRREMISLLAKPSLRGRDLRKANLVLAFMAGIDLRDARLTAASMAGARLENAVMRGAILDGSLLDGARLDGASLRHARLRYARMRGTHLYGADLRFADLRGADLTGTMLVDLPLHGADLSDVTNLTQAQLVNVIGDKETKLPKDAETGEQLTIGLCWGRKPQSFYRLIEMQFFTERAEFRNRVLCRNGVTNAANQSAHSSKK